MHKFLGTIFAFGFLPLFAHAQTFASLVNDILGIIGLLIPLIVALIFLVIMWSVLKSWIINNEDSDAIEKGKKTLIWGIVALVVSFSLWGIVALLRTTFFA